MGIYNKMTTKEYIEHRADKEYELLCKEFNKELCKKYPWLIPTNAFSGKRITDCCGEDGEEGFWPGTPENHPDYDWEYTEMDEMPDGWRLAFGDEMCEEIQKDLVAHDYVNEFWITQIKEKYGMLCFYTGSIPKDSDIFNIIDKYEHMSRKICINCGAPATRMTTGWISPFCAKCANKFENTVPIEEFYDD